MLLQTVRRNRLEWFMIRPNKADSWIGSSAPEVRNPGSHVWFNPLWVVGPHKSHFTSPAFIFLFNMRDWITKECWLTPIMGFYSIYENYNLFFIHFSPWKASILPVDWKIQPLILPKFIPLGPDILTVVVGSDISRCPNTPRPTCRGYLHKRTHSGFVKSWRKRWFVLKHDGCLHYYRHKKVNWGQV